MIYAAFLRGINVGGKNIVKMADLREMLSKLGFKGVKTYIQSGNAVFDSPFGETETADKIGEAMHKALGFKVPVMLRTRDELSEIITQCPYTERLAGQPAQEATKLYVGMTELIIEDESHARLDEIAEAGDSYKSAGRNIYIWFANGVGRSKFAPRLESAVGSVTLRNWNTINKVYSMAQELI